MKRVFVDTLYWIASINPRDQWHSQVLALDAKLKADFVTTESVLIEVLNYFSGFGADIRLQVAIIVDDLLQSEKVEIVPQTRSAFISALELYRARKDKGYSLTDCLSMQTMRERNITEVLTHDHHFAQEGFTLLL